MAITGVGAKESILGIGELVQTDCKRLANVRELLADAERLALGARVLATGRLSRITVAVPATTLAEVITPFIATLGPGDPTPSAFASDGQDLKRALRAGADLVIANGRPADLVPSLEIGVLPVWAYLPGAHQWATREAIDLTELTAETVISLPTTSSGRQALDAAAIRTQQTVRVDIEASSGAVAQALAAAGRGVAVVTDDPRFDLSRLRVLASGHLVNIHLHAGWDPDHPAHLTLAAMARRLAKHIADHYGSPE